MAASPSAHSTPSRFFAAMLVLLLGSATAALALEESEAEGDYTLDKDHASLLWKVDHLGFSSYVGRFNSFDGTLTFYPDYPTGSKLDVVIDAASVDVNNPSFAQELRGEDWFNTSAHPKIRFTSTEIKQTGTDSGKVTGNLTLMGVTRPVTLDVEMTGKGRHIKTGRYTLGFKATGTLDRADFGLDRMIGLIGNSVTLEIHVEFTKR